MISKLPVLIVLLFGVLPLFLMLFTKATKNYAVNAIKPYLWVVFAGDFQEFMFAVLDFHLRFKSFYSIHIFILYNVAQFIALLWFFYRISDSFKQNHFIGIAILFLVTTICSLFIGLDLMSAYVAFRISILISTIMIFVCSFSWFYQAINKNTQKSLVDFPEFYMVSGIFVFALVTFTPLYFIESIAKNGFLHKMYVSVIYFSILLRIVLAVGVWKAHYKNTN